MGEAIAVDGTYAIVGGPNADQIDPAGTTGNVGAAWIFERDSTTSLDSEQRWFFEKLVQHPTEPGQPLDQLGFSVGISGNRAIVGAPNDKHGQPILQFAGSAFVYHRSGAGVWTFEGPAIRLAAPSAGDFLGWSVAIDDTTSPPRAVVGSPEIQELPPFKTGATHVFELISNAWVEQARLPTPSDGDLGADVGMAVAVDGDTVVVGAPAHDHGTEVNSGGAYVYVGGGSSWAEQGEVIPTGVGVLTAGDEYGCSVDIDGDTIVVGAPADDPVTTNQGSAFVFERVNGSWGIPQTIVANNPTTGERFGTTVSIDSGRIVVGCKPGPGAGTGAGEKAYLFELDPSTSQWSQVAVLTSGNAESDSEMGYAVAVSGDSVVVGAPNDDTCDVLKPVPAGAPPTPTPGFPQSGAAYFFAPFNEAHEFYGVPEPTGQTCSGNPGSHLTTNGIASMSDPDPFYITANNATFVAVGPTGCSNTGVLAWGVMGRRNMTYPVGGTLLVQDQMRLVPEQFYVFSGTCPPTSPCGYNLAYDFNELIQSGTDSDKLFIGQKVNVQWILNNEFEGVGTNLKEATDAVEFIICP